MTRYSSVLAAVLAAALLAGCVASSAVPISRDAWRLQVSVDEAAPAPTVESRVLHEAAALAFRNGAPFFLIGEAPPADASDQRFRAVLYGDTRVFFIAPAATTGRQVTAAVTVTLLLDRDDPRAARAYDTLEVLAR